jgi:hypothetical protein
VYISLQTEHSIYQKLKSGGVLHSWWLFELFVGRLTDDITLTGESRNIFTNI